MHNGAKNTPEALPTVIEAIKSEGYEIVPISQILLKGEYYTDVDGKCAVKPPHNRVREGTFLLMPQNYRHTVGAFIGRPPSKGINYMLKQIL